MTLPEPLAELDTMRRLPAEWEPQSGVLMTWPHQDTNWRNQLDTVNRLWAQIAAAIARFEPVLILCRDQAHRELVSGLAEAAGAPSERLRLALAPSNDSWTRDHGPLTVLDPSGTPLLLDFRFNGWGGKWPSQLDDGINLALQATGQFGRLPWERHALVLEGGAIETDGLGTLLAVERTLVDPRRNPDLDRAAIESHLRQYLGIRRFLWLTHGQISGDDTDGHIDTLARFCDPRTLCYVTCDDPEDPDYPGLKAMESELRAFRDAEGKPYRLVPLPSPRPILDANGGRLPAGYANFLIINGAILIPVYDDPADAQAQAILGGLFPGRETIAVDCRPLIRCFGSLHCVTMQLPEAVLR